MKKDRWGIWHYIRSYKFNSIFLKSFFLVALPTLIPLIIISFSVYNYNRANIQDEIKTANVNSLTKIKSMVDLIAVESDRLSSRYASDDDDIKILLSYNHIDNQFYTYDKFRNLYKTFGFITATNDFFNSVYVYFENSQFVLATDGYSMDLANFTDKNWMEEYYALRDNYISWVSPRAVAKPFSSVPQYFISTFRPIKNYGFKGVVIVNIDTQKLKNIIDNVDDKKQHNLIISESDGTILYNTDTSIFGRNIKDIDYLQKLSLDSSDSYFTDSTGGVKQIVTVLNSEYNNWKYIFITPVSQYSQRTEELKSFMFFSVASSILIAIVIAFFISLRVLQPIKNMLSLLDTPQDWEGLINIEDGKNFDEFKYLAKGFLNSLDRTRQVEEAMKERLTLLRKAQSVALQAQINPHFLYNTLETINWKAMGLTGGENEVSNMLSSLSQLLRLSLETVNNLVSIEKEIEHAKLYVDIQKIRYKEKFEVIWDIDSEISNNKIVKLSIQPLIENAIYHGIKPKKEKGTISVTCCKKDNSIMIEILDDGMGLSQEEVTALNLDMKDEYIKEDLHIGMKNVNQRIKLFFGDEYGLTVESEYKKYTSVKIFIPIVE